MAIFAHIAEAGSITAAAKTLGLPKSTVSSRLKELEERLDVVLVYRTTRRLTLTEQGRQFLESCQELVRIGDGASRIITGGGQEPAGNLVIGCPYGMSESVLPQVISAFLQQYPRVNIKIIASNDRLDLQDHAVDIAFRFGQLEDSASLVMRKVGQLDRLLLASPGYLDKAGLLKHPRDLVNHQCILSSHNPVWHFGEDTADIEIFPPRRVEVNDLMLAKTMAMDDAGICMLPVLLLGDAIERGQLVTVLPDFKLPPGPLSLVYQRHDVENISVRRFIDMYVAHLRDAAPNQKPRR